MKNYNWREVYISVDDNMFTFRSKGKTCSNDEICINFGKIKIMEVKADTTRVMVMSKDKSPTFEITYNAISFNITNKFIAFPLYPSFLNLKHIKINVI